MPLSHILNKTHNVPETLLRCLWKGEIHDIILKTDKVDVHCMEDRIKCKKNIPLAIGQQLQDSNGAIGIIEKIAQEFILEDNIMYHFQLENDDEIVTEQVNVISIYQAKGLEFEKVIVLSNNMTLNELYVATTRALNELIVLTYNT